MSCGAPCLRVHRGAVVAQGGGIHEPRHTVHAPGQRVQASHLACQKKQERDPLQQSDAYQQQKLSKNAATTHSVTDLACTTAQWASTLARVLKVCVHKVHGTTCTAASWAALAASEEHTYAGRGHHIDGFDGTVQPPKTKSTRALDETMGSQSEADAAGTRK